MCVNVFTYLGFHSVVTTYSLRVFRVDVQSSLFISRITSSVTSAAYMFCLAGQPTLSTVIGSSFQSVETTSRSDNIYGAPWRSANRITLSLHRGGEGRGAKTDGTGDCAGWPAICRQQASFDPRQVVMRSTGSNGLWLMKNEWKYPVAVSRTTKLKSPVASFPNRSSTNDDWIDPFSRILVIFFRNRNKLGLAR